MVESQVRPSDVTDRRIMTAMMAVPRERFVPQRLAGLAYMDTALTLDGGRSLMAPRDFARLIQLAGIESDERVLDVGSGGGYSAAVLARMAGTVVALDCDATATAGSRSALAEVGADNVTAVTGPLQDGWTDGAPYDVMVVEGGVSQIPEALKAQLAPGGRLVAAVVTAGIGRAVVWRREAGDGAPRVAFEIGAPRLPGFDAATPRFEL
ncbi:MAG: protein-L-isoaspartate O-methyltransferase family protein [Hyphomicrobium sp.]